MFLYKQANIRIDMPSAQYGDNPWVSQTAGCGIPGEYMHLTPVFLTDVDRSRRIWGSAGQIYME